jgi:hypothetical protein
MKLLAFDAFYCLFIVSRKRAATDNAIANISKQSEFHHECGEIDNLGKKNHLNSKIFILNILKT